MLASGYVELDAGSIYRRTLIYSGAPNEDGDVGTFSVSASSITFDGKYGILSGSIRGDTLHEVYHGADYAFTR